MCTDHQWINNAIRKIEADYQRSADTHLIKLDLPSVEGIDIYLKDESTHPTGSLKHRLARSLFLYAICNGWVGSETTIIESSSGSTAVSEAYFARLLGLPFIADKLWYKTPFVRSHNMDLHTGIREFNVAELVAEERAEQARWPRWKKVYKWFC